MSESVSDELASDLALLLVKAACSFFLFFFFFFFFFFLSPDLPPGTLSFTDGAGASLKPPKATLLRILSISDISCTGGGAGGWTGC